MTKPGKIYKNPDGWAVKAAIAAIIVGTVIGLGGVGLLVWFIVEVIQFIGRH